MGEEDLGDGVRGGNEGVEGTRGEGREVAGEGTGREVGWVSS